MTGSCGLAHFEIFPLYLQYFVNCLRPQILQDVQQTLEGLRRSNVQPAMFHGLVHTIWRSRWYIQCLQGGIGTLSHTHLLYMGMYVHTYTYVCVHTQHMHPHLHICACTVHTCRRTHTQTCVHTHMHASRSSLSTNSAGLQLWTEARSHLITNYKSWVLTSVRPLDLLGKLGGLGLKSSVELGVLSGREYGALQTKCLPLEFQVLCHLTNGLFARLLGYHLQDDNATALTNAVSTLHRKPLDHLQLAHNQTATYLMESLSNRIN